MLECFSCGFPVEIDPATDRMPPWCAHCGADLKLRQPKSNAPGTNDPYAEALTYWNRRPAASPAPAAPPAKPTTSPREETGILIVTVLPEAPTPPEPPPARRPREPEDSVPALRAAAEAAALAPSATASRPRARHGFLALAVVAFLVALLLAHSTMQKLLSDRTTQGTVARLVPTGNGGTRPEVNYTMDGDQYTILCGSSSGLRPGDTVLVRCAPGSPGNGSIDRFWDHWWAPLFCAGISAAMFVLWVYSAAKSATFVAVSQRR